MTDGPFDNLNLGKGWKKFVKAIQNNATDISKCAAIAADTMIKECLTNNASSTIPSGKFQKESKSQLHNGTTFEKTGPASVISYMSECSNRIQEEFIYLHDSGQISANQCQISLEKTNATFRAVDKQGIRNAVLSGNKNAFKEAASKEKNLDDGPVL